MGKIQRVVVCGDGLALAGIKTSLGLDEDCEVSGHAMPVAASELRELNPDVIIFDLNDVPHELIYALSNELPRLPQQPQMPGQPQLLMIGIDLETNRAVLWLEQQVEGWTSQDLAQVIQRTGKTGPLHEADEKGH